MKKMKYLKWVFGTNIANKENEEFNWWHMVEFQEQYTGILMVYLKMVILQM